MAGLLNILTDLVIIVLPMPMLWRVRLPLRRKAALGLLFGSGALVMVCTILRNYYVLAAVTDEQLAQLWASREAFASMVVVSIPAIWSLVRKRGWLGHYDGGGGARGGGRGGGGGGALPGAGNSVLWKSSASRAVGSQAGPDEFEMSLRIKGNNNHNDDEEDGRLGDGDSEDRIIVPGLSSMMSSQTSDHSIAGGGRGLGGSGGGGGVRVTREYSVRFEHGGEDVAEHVKQRGMNWTSEYR